MHLSDHASSPQAWFAAAVGLALVIVAVYEHFRRDEAAQAAGVTLAALGLFFWAGFQWPIYFLFGVVSLAVLVPWLVWSGRSHAAFAAVISRLPITADIRIRRRTKAEPFPLSARGQFDFEADGVAATLELTGLYEEMTRLMGNQSKSVTRHGRRMQRAAQRGVSARRKVRLAEAAAKDINKSAVKMEHLEERIRGVGSDMIQNMSDLLKAQPQAKVGDFHELAKVTASARANMGQYRQAVRGLREQGVSQAINTAADHLTAVVDRLIENVKAVEQFYRKNRKKS